MSTRLKVATASFWALAGSAFANIASFAVFAVLARILGPSDFGIVAFASVFIEVSRSIALAGIPLALVKEPEWNDEIASTAFWGNFGVGTVLTVIVASASPLFIDSHYGSDITLVMIALSLSLLIDVVRATHEAKLQREFSYKSLAKRTAFATTGAGFVAVILALTGFGIWALVLNRLASSIIQTFIVWNAARWSPKRRFVRAEFSRMFAFGVHLSASAVLGQINRRVPDLIAGFFIGTVSVGYYRVGSRIVAILMDITIRPMQSVSLAGFSRVSDQGGKINAFLRITKITGLVAFPLYLGISVLADDLVVLLFGNKWQSSGWILSALAFFGVAAVFTYFVEPLLASLGEARIISLRSLFNLLSNSIVCLLCAPYGIVAIAVGFAVNAYLGLIATLILLNGYAGLRPLVFIRGLAPPLISSLMMYSTVFLLRDHLLHIDTFLRLAILSSCGLFVYLVAMLILFRNFTATVRKDLDPVVKAAISRTSGAVG